MRLRRLIAFLLLGFSVACQPLDHQPVTTAVSNEPADGDAYVDSSLGDPARINPLLASDSATGDIVAQVYNGLIKYDKDLKLVGELAESFEVRRGGLEILFKLRRNVTWHDGVPFTAADVQFTFDKLRDPKVQTPFSSDFELVQSFHVLDPYTIRVTYKRPFAPGLASWGMGIIAKHIYEKGDINNHPANRHPIGTGPYIFKEWKTSEYVLLEANPTYFEGKPHLARYVYRIIPDQSVQFLEMRNQGVDSTTLTPDQFKAYDSIFEHHQRYRTPSFAYTYLAFNLKNPLFKDVRVRRAMAMSMDRAKLVDGLLLGLGQPITGPFPISSWAYNKDVQQIPFDPKAAEKLFNEAGWKRNANGILEKNGQPFAFTLMTNQGNKLRSLAAEIIQGELEKAGIQVNIRILEWSTFIRQYVDPRNYEAIILGWNTARDPDNYSMWHSSQQKPGQYNFCAYENANVDRWLVEGRETFDQTKRQAIYRKIHAQIAQDLPYIFLYCPDSLVAIHKRIHGIQVAPAGLGWNFREWYVPQSEQRYPTRITVSR